MGRIATYLDYGFLENTTVSDGQEVDIWIGSLNKKRATAILCTRDSNLIFYYQPLYNLFVFLQLINITKYVNNAII